jgi:hypothetical protein
MKPNPLPSREYLIECFGYDPETGVVLWNRRPDSHFKNGEDGWNGRWAGKVAGSLDSWGYMQIRINGRVYKLHRVIWKLMTGSDPIDQIDHVDQDRTNNRWSNLRAATGAENGRNRSLQSNNSSGYTGVQKYGNRWWAGYWLDGRKVHVGYYDTPEEANEALIEARAAAGFHPNHGRAVA